MALWCQMVRAVHTIMADVAADVQAGLADLADTLAYQPAGGATLSVSGFAEAIDLTRVTASGVQAGDLKVIILGRYHFGNAQGG